MIHQYTERKQELNFREIPVRRECTILNKNR